MYFRDAIAKTGKVALSSVVIARRERVVALRPMDNGLVVHTLHEERDLNSAKEAFEHVPDGRGDPEMVDLAVQLITRQSGRFDPGDFEDRYESRLRKLIEAKLKGKGLEPEEEEPRDRDNVVNLMAALKRSLGKSTSEKTSAPAKVRRSSSKTPAKGASVAKRPDSAHRGR